MPLIKGAEWHRQQTWPTQLLWWDTVSPRYRINEKKALGLLKVNRKMRICNACIMMYNVLGERGLFGVRWREGMLMTSEGYQDAIWGLSHVLRSITSKNRQRKILRDENSLSDNLSVLFYQNLLRMVNLINFHLFLPTPSTEYSIRVQSSLSTLTLLMRSENLRQNSIQKDLNNQTGKRCKYRTRWFFKGKHWTRKSKALYQHWPY